MAGVAAGPGVVPRIGQPLRAEPDGWDRPTGLAGDGGHDASVLPLRRRRAGMRPQGSGVDRGCVREALALLRDPESVERAVRAVPVAAATLGFDRVLYSQIVHGRWMPVAAAGESGWAAEVVERGRRRPKLIDRSLAEHDLVRRARPILVPLTGGSAGHGPPAWPTRGYVAVPVVQAGSVIGMLHADFPSRGCCPGAAEQAALWTFAEGVGHVLAEAALLDSLRRLRGRLASLAYDIPPEPDPVGPGCAAGEVAPAADDADRLTRREREVLDLMAAGRTNGQIARQLVITEGTVKSHVKRILCKTGTANRAEAAAVWVRGSGRPT